ncbi:MAG: hypothetical protein K2Y21_02190 [Phycisphaerales bacterium]|nr:hypothetical protein [Phycisphaerales bacterium]
MRHLVHPRLHVRGFVAVGAAVFCAVGAAPAPSLAGVAYRFTGTVVLSRGSTRLVYKQFDRSDAGGQDIVQFHEFPPASLESRNISAVSSAGPGYLSVSAHADITKTDIGGFSITENLTGDAFAGVTWDDVVVSGPPGTTLTSFNLALDGSLIAGAPAQATASSNAQLTFYYNNDNIGGGAYVRNVSSGSTTVTANGSLSNFPANPIIASPFFQVPTNTPLKIGIGLSANARVSLNLSLTGNPAANSDFGHTLTLATDRPVFILPPGYTVNSVQAGIVNNSFKRPCPADFNNDTRVDDADFQIFVVAYDLLDCADPAMPPLCPADLNLSTAVDDADFQQFVAAYNELLCP